MCLNTADAGHVLACSFATHLVQKGGHLVLGRHFLLMRTCQAHPAAADLPDVDPG